MVIQFFDTLRVENLGSIYITIACPGAVATEMTAGKLLNEEGELELNLERRDVLLSVL